MGEGSAIPPGTKLTGQAKGAWAAATEGLRKQLPASTFALWLAPLELAGEFDGTLIVVAPTPLAAWVRRQYVPTLAAAVRANHGFTGLRVEDG